MKNFKMYMSSLAIIALLFTSCSKEESGIIENDSEKATLSFGAILNDIAANRAATKQAIGEMPACSDDDPAYVRIVLMRGDTEVVGTAANPYRVNLAPGQIFTVEDAELELEQGNYTLTHFSVYNAAGELIWLAPRGGDLANFVDTPLPLAIDLRAGVKKYVDVPVLCFDNREVIQYGYQFFEINTNRVVDFCFFANYCDASGMHFAARYRVDVWQGTNENGTVLYSNLTSQTGINNDGDFFASPVCVALPANDDDRNEDYIYYRLTLLDWDENYGDAPASVITGTLSLADIEANFGDGDDVDYEHFRFGCGDDDGGNGGETPSDRDNDGVPDATDNCPDTAGSIANSGCPEPTPCDQTDPNADCDGDLILNKCDEDNPNYATFDCDGDGVLNGPDQCETVAGTVDNNGCPEETGTTCEMEEADAGCLVALLEGTNNWTMVSDPGSESPEFFGLLSGGEPVGSATIIIDDGNVVVIGNMGFDYVLDDYIIEVSQNANGSGSVCVAENDVTPATGEDPDIFEIFNEATDFVYPVYVRISANVCN